MTTQVLVTFDDPTDAQRFVSVVNDPTRFSGVDLSAQFSEDRDPVYPYDARVLSPEPSESPVRPGTVLIDGNGDYWRVQRDTSVARREPRMEEYSMVRPTVPVANLKSPVTRPDYERGEGGGA